MLCDGRRMRLGFFPSVCLFMTCTNKQVRFFGRRLQAGEHCVVEPLCTQLTCSSDVGDARFDLIVSSMVMHHIESLSTTLSTLGLLLKSGGHLFIFDLLKEKGTWEFHSAHAHAEAGVHHGHVRCIPSTRSFVCLTRLWEMRSIGLRGGGAESCVREGGPHQNRVRACVLPLEAG
jgi:hypothetical protein